MRSSSRNNEIHFVAKRNKNTMTSSISEFSWEDREIDKYQSSENQKMDYAKLLRSIAFQCLSKASEYEISDEGKEWYPDVLTKNRLRKQLSKMNLEQESKIDDNGFNVMTCARTIERILKDKFNIDMCFDECYMNCSEVCKSNDLLNPDVIKCDIINDDAKQSHTLYVEMYKPNVDAEFGIVISLIVINSEGQRFLFEKEFLVHYRCMK